MELMTFFKLMHICHHCLIPLTWKKPTPLLLHVGLECFQICPLGRFCPASKNPRWSLSTTQDRLVEEFSNKRLSFCIDSKSHQVTKNSAWNFLQLQLQPDRHKSILDPQHIGNTSIHGESDTDMYRVLFLFWAMCQAFHVHLFAQSP